MTFTPVWRSRREDAEKCSPAVDQFILQTRQLAHIPHCMKPAQRPTERAPCSLCPPLTARQTPLFDFTFDWFHSAFALELIFQWQLHKNGEMLAFPPRVAWSAPSGLFSLALDPEQTVVSRLTSMTSDAPTRVGCDWGGGIRNVRDDLETACSSQIRI